MKNPRVAGFAVSAVALAVGLAACASAPPATAAYWEKVYDTPSDLCISGITVRDGAVWLTGGQIKNTRNLYELVDGAPAQRGAFDAMVAGVANDGKELWIASAGDGKLKRVADDGSVLAVVPNPNTVNSTGLCWAAGYLWNTGYTGEIFKIDPSGRLAATIKSPAHDMQGIVVVGNRIFVVDQTNNVLLKLDLRGRLLETIPVPEACQAPMALAFDGRDFWLSGQPGSGLFRCRGLRP
jgi:sugar lactone lactonase YvrE